MFACGFHVNEQFVHISNCTMHTIHSISSCDGAEIVKAAKRRSWSRFNIFRTEFRNICSRLRKYYFYGSHLCH